MRIGRNLTLVLVLQLMIFSPAFAMGSDSSTGTGNETRNTSIDLIYDDILEVPPGGGSQILISEDGTISTEGYRTMEIDDDTKIGKAASLLPDWLREDFIRNMLEASSDGTERVETRSSFGDLDGDGDDDMALVDGETIHFLKNIGHQGNPIFQFKGFDRHNEGYVIDQTSWVSIEIFDLDRNGFGDIIYGDDSYMLGFIMNPLGPEDESYQLRTMYVASSAPPTYLSPTVWYMDQSDLVFILGSRSGIVYSWTVEPTVEDGIWGFNMNGPPQRIDDIIPSINMSAPRVWNRDRMGDISYSNSLAVGSQEGVTRFFWHEGPISRIANFDPVPGYFSNIPTTGPTTPAPADLNGDQNTDLVMDTGNGLLISYPNMGTDTDPYWAPDPHIPAFEVENYRSAFGNPLDIYNQDGIEEYLDLIISPPDTRYRDEIGFSCAFTPPSQLAGNRLSRLLLENVRDIYERDIDLEYVRIVDKRGANPYTTASYRVRVGDQIKEMEITRDAYYWGIVHPRVTEEVVAYIDPETGAQESPVNGGRFWREYLYEHADNEYPPGPDFPDDWEGRKVYYPRDETPPLLKEVLENVDVYWDLQPYEYPAGFDHNGKNNSHPWDYRDHAIEKVSHWVEKTLVLNQQESPDEERPNQPVRIAHGHNGNCGELQDLTIAGARCALIPARGVHLTGEDHVWSEFYLGGWHQWDNYWSDGGGVVANDLNYWWGWGRRGGSGVWASNGAGQTFDVGQRYRAPDVTGSLSFNVVDDQGSPVEGARVVVLSHWTMENAIDTGDYQGPIPTIPLPSIWGYTDMNGYIEFKVWGQSFNYRVTSDLGTYISEKFTMEDDSHMGYLVRLQAEKPPQDSYTLVDGFDDQGKRYMLSIEVLDSFQYQEDPTTGVLFRNQMGSGHIATNIYTENSLNSRSPIFRQEISHHEPFTKAFYNSGWNMTISLDDLNTFNTYTRARVRIYEVKGEISEDPVLIPVNPSGPDNEGIEISSPPFLKGFLVMNNSVDPIESYDLWLRNSIADTYGEWVEDGSSPPGIYQWRFKEVFGEPGSIDQMAFDIVDNTTIINSLPISIKIKDGIGPMWYSLIGNGTSPWGSSIELGFTLFGTGGYESLYWLDYQDLGVMGSEKIDYFEHEIINELDTSMYSSGNHKVRMATMDMAGSIRTLVFNVKFDAVPPEMDIFSPSPGSSLTTDSIFIDMEVKDDVEVTSVIVSLLDQKFDLTDEMDEMGRIAVTVDFKGELGTIPVNINVTDNVGLWNYTTMIVERLPPPDQEAPTLMFYGPRDQTRFEKGEKINFRGSASDANGIERLTLSVGAYRSDITGEIEGGAFSHEVATDLWSTGKKDVTLRGADPSGNQASVSMEIEIYEVVDEFVDRERPEIALDEPKEGQEFQLGSTFTVSGLVTDDGNFVELYCSIDQGESYFTIPLEGDRPGTFSFKIDTVDILETLDVSPSQLRSYLSNYGIILRVEDSVERERRLQFHVAIKDTLPPEVISPEVKYNEDAGTITISAEVIDDSLISEVSIEILDEDGRKVRGEILTGGRIRDQRIDWTAYGPFPDGQYTVSITVKDAWDNSVSTDSDLKIEDMEEKDGSSELGRTVLISIILLILVIPLIAYLFVKALGRAGKRP